MQIYDSKDAIAKARREGAISVSLPGFRVFAFPLRERSLFETDNIYVHVGSEKFTINTWDIKLSKDNKRHEQINIDNLSTFDKIRFESIISMVIK